MRLPLTLLALLLQLISALEDKCPKGDYACIDIMNSSQCIEQLIIEKLAPATKEALIKCVEYEGVASTLPGASKYCRCPGCHTQAINSVIEEMFPPPCA